MKVRSQMRILLGAGITEQASSPAVQLIKRLRFNAVQVEAVRVVQTPIFPVGEPGMSVPLVYGNLLEEAISNAKFITDALAIELGGASAGGQVLHGSAASELLSRADETGADLIAVEGHEYKPVVAALIGSVARALLLGAKQSVLLAKPSDAPLDRPIRAVLATDHSEYASACWEHLIRFWPRGIEHLTVLTAYPEDQPEALPDITLRSEKVIEKLTGKLGSRETIFQTHTAPGKPSEVIAATMAQTGAELLILGAKGHSMLERLILGSVSFAQAVGEHPYSVLILRA